MCYNEFIGQMPVRPAKRKGETPLKAPICLLVSLALLCPLLLGCQAPSSAFGDTERIKVCATLFPQYEFARAVGGERVEVVKLLPGGSESHTYEPSPADIVTLEDADLFLTTGPSMEPWADRVISGLSSPPRTLALSLSVPCLEEDDHDHDHSHDHGHDHAVDPHIWTSPIKAMAMTEAVRDALIELDPEGRAVYEANAAAYLAELAALDEDLVALSRASEGKTLVFGGRFAFAHLCADYGFAYLSAYRSCDVSAEPSPADIAAVIDYIRQSGTAYLFREELVEPRTVRTIAEETGAAVLLLHSCHNVTRAELESGVSYLSLMQDNLRHLTLALTGQ